MEIIPVFANSCALAVSMPECVADFLESGLRIKRRFREESVTDIIVSSLIKMHGKDVLVIVPDETKTGSDFDIVILDIKTRNAVQFRIQAKQISENLKNWNSSSYRELAHPNGTGRQSSNLINSSAHESILTIPLYAFYHPQRICDASDGEISGLEMADGRAVRAIVNALVSMKPKRPPLKRISVLRTLFFPLSTILCSNSKDTSLIGLGIPSPTEVYNASRAAILNRNTNFVEIERSLLLSKDRRLLLDNETTTRRLSSRTTTSRRSHLFLEKFPEYILRALERRGVEQATRAPVKRTKVILISKTE
jgi:hypothetical protein